MYTVIVGDSMVKYLNPKRLKRSMSTGNQNIIETYRGSNTEAMSHHIKPCIDKKPDYIVLHVGTNDIKDKQPKEIVDGIVKIQEIIRKESQKQSWLYRS
jgi:lysophospholipase L1-like esterase